MEDELISARSLVAAGELQEARGRLLLSPKADNPLILAALAGVEIKLGQYAEALATLDRAVAAAPADGRLIGLRATALQASGALDDCIAEYLEASRLLPEWTMPVARLAALYVMTGKVCEGKELARKALRVNPRNLTAIAALVEAATREGGHELGNQVTRHLYPSILRTPSQTSPSLGVTIIKGIGSNRLRLNALGLPVPIDGHINIDERLTGCEVTQICIDSFNFAGPLPSGQLVVNAMADADQLCNPLEQAARLLHGTGYCVINAPELVLLSGRDSVCRILQGIPGLVVPATIRASTAKDDNRSEEVRKAIETGALSLPVLLRPVGSHNGNDVHIVTTTESIRQTIRELPSSIYATQLVDTRGGDGLFRKTRLFCIGGEWFVEHHFVSESWCVHASGWIEQMHQRPQLLQEARMAAQSMLLPNDRRLRTIADRLRLDVFGVDLYWRPSGELVLFEANACMRVSTEEQIPQLGDHMKVAVRKIRDAFGSLLKRYTKAASRGSDDTASLHMQ